MNISWVLTIIIGCSVEITPGWVDADGDGFIASLDCDDANPEINPGAEELWYDDVDQDCLGDSDYDADGDGVYHPSGAGLDCNDEDPGIYPGALEVWYDGVDRDCDGASDYDADADGHDSDGFGGDDCNDALPNVYPGAAEIWFDGVDGDCNGGDDYDADGDGWRSEVYGGQDCDDGDAAIYPGAEEVYYDGVDGDCDGGGDYDADGDGFDSDVYGGDDCNDEMASVFPGGEEILNGVVDDCNGHADQIWASEDFGQMTLFGSGVGDNAGAWLSSGDFTGDGSNDLAIMSSVVSANAWTEDAVYLFPNADIVHGAVVAGAPKVVHSSDGIGFDKVSLLSDLDNYLGDEIAISATSQGVRTGGFGMVSVYAYGAIQDQVSIDDADRYFYHNQDIATGAVGFGGTVSSLSDMTGDGQDEVIITAPGVESGKAFLWSSNAIGVANATSWSFSSNDAGVVFVGTNGGWDQLGYSVADLGDVNNDGAGDFAIGVPALGEVYVISGDPNLFGSGEISAISTAEVIITAHVNAAQAAMTGFGSSLASGDIDGDGILDLVIGAPDTNNGYGAFHVVLGDSLVSGTQPISNISAASVLGISQTGLAGVAVAVGDVDGDDLDDILIGGSGTYGAVADSGRAWLIQSAVNLTSMVSLDQASSVVAGESEHDRVGQAIGLSDIDGDGRADVLIGVPGEETVLTDEGAVLIGISQYQ